MTQNQNKPNLRPIIGLALISLLICGVFFPLLITGIAQVFFPSQANGEIVQVNGQAVGSSLIAQNFSLPLFFHPRNDSASGVDPDITLDDAYGQIPRISNATGISVSELKAIVDDHREGAVWVFGNPYVNVLQVNLDLINLYPTVYGDFVP